MAPKVVDLRPSLQKSPKATERPAQVRRQPPKRTAPLRMRRRRTRLFVIAGIVLLVMLLIAGIHYIAYRPSLRIQEISVRGTRLQNPSHVETFVRERLRDDSFRYVPLDGIFSYPRAELQAAIPREFPRLHSVRIGRAAIASTRLIINVDERDIFATWCDEVATRCYVFDESGFIFADATAVSERPESSYTFSGGIDGDPIGKTFLGGRLHQTMDLLQRLREGRFVPLSVHVDSAEDFSVRLQNGYVIKASFSQDIDTIIHNLELIAVAPAIRGRDAELEYIDLRFGNRVYYKFKGEAAVEQ